MARMVQEAMTYLDRAPSLEVRVALLETLRLVTDGKIFVETERARLTRTLARIREDEGKVAEAADVLQALQVETLGSMDKKEKTDFILEQMRLLLAKGDHVRVLLVSKKINPRYFDRADDDEVQVRSHTDRSYWYICMYVRMSLCVSFPPPPTHTDTPTHTHTHTHPRTYPHRHNVCFTLGDSFCHYVRVSLCVILTHDGACGNSGSSYGTTA
jgi:hypothetical protein